MGRHLLGLTSFRPGRGGQELLPAEESIVICVAPPKPFRRLGRRPANAELSQAEPAVLVGVERGKLGGPGVAIPGSGGYFSAWAGLTECGVRAAVGGTRREGGLATKPEGRNDYSGQETGYSDGKQQRDSLHDALRLDYAVMA